MSKPKRYWMMKSEPDAFGIDDLERVGTEPWNGVRNYQARNFMRDGMREGDGVMIYHSNCKVPGIAGIARVASAAYPDETQFDATSKYFDEKASREQPRWFLVDVGFERKLHRVGVRADQNRALIKKQVHRTRHFFVNFEIAQRRQACLLPLPVQLLDPGETLRRMDTLQRDQTVRLHEDRADP